MSRTYKKNKWDYKPSHKLNPYLAEKDYQNMKFVAESYTGTAPTKQNKLLTRNANRSKKKAARQEAKQLIKESIDYVTNDM